MYRLSSFSYVVQKGGSSATSACYISLHLLKLYEINAQVCLVVVKQKMGDFIFGGSGATFY